MSEKPMSIRYALRATQFRGTVETARGPIDISITSYVDEKTGRECFSAHGWDRRDGADRTEDEDGEYFSVGKNGPGMRYFDSFDGVVAACDAKLAELTAGDASAKPSTLPGLKQLRARVGDVTLGQLALLAGKVAADA